MMASINKIFAIDNTSSILGVPPLFAHKHKVAIAQPEIILGKKTRLNKHFITDDTRSTSKPERGNTHQSLVSNGKMLLRKRRYGGAAFIASGTSNIVTVEDQPAERRVFLHEQQTMQLVDMMWSNSDGTYRFDNLDSDCEYVLIGLDNPDSNYRPQAWDKLKPTKG